MRTDVEMNREIAAVMDELEDLLKNPDIGAELTAEGINTSLALLVAQGLRAYLRGKKREAADDLGTAAEEIGARLEGTAGNGPSPTPSSKRSMH